MKNKFLTISISIAVLLIGISAFYYYVIFLPQKEKHRIEIEDQKQAESIKNNCIDSVLEEMRKENPNMETKEITNYRIANDRGCFIEAGCMQGVQDDYFKPKFEECSNEYYYSCLNELKKVVEEKIEQEKLRRIDECIKLYKD